MVTASRVKLYLTEEQKQLFEENLDKFFKCTNWWIDKIREIESTKIGELQKKFYREAKTLFNMKAVQTQLCMVRAIRVSRTAKKRRSESPYLTKKQLYFNTFKKKVGEIGLTFGSRNFFVKYGGEIKEGQLKESYARKINEEWYLYLMVKTQEPKEKKYKRCMGVDLGISKIAVICDWNGNNTKFFRGEPLRNVKNHYLKLRKSMQENLDKGNTYKALKNISGKENRWTTDINHKISREIVDIAIKNKRTIVIEKLTGISQRIKVNKKTRTMLHGWSFRQLTDFIKYKAKMAGIKVLEVDPRGTSKACSKCGHYSRSNRKSQERFICQSCGYETNADRNAAINIAKRGTELLASQ